MSEPEFYPMPMFVRLFVQDVNTSTRWYQDALGFQPVYVMPGPDGVPQMVHLRLGRYQDLMLLPDPPGAALPSTGRGQGATISLSLEGGIDALADRARGAGAQIVTGPVDRPWNVREFTVQDPDGYQLTFSQVIDALRDFDDVMSGDSPAL
jgi:catechol 2,3-dioxygenase-like lactoylglutathione lyase family enzyme